MSIRRLTRGQWREYRRLRLRALADSPDAYSTTLAEARDRDAAAWSRQVSSGAEAAGEIALVAQVDSGLVGLVWGRLDAENPHRVDLYQMWVDPEFRRCGVGTTLLSTAIRWARSVNARVIALSVTGGDTPATRLYARAGFKPCGPQGPLRPESDLVVQPVQLDLR